MNVEIESIRTLIDVLGWPVAILLALRKRWLVNGPDHDAALRAKEERIADLEREAEILRADVARWQNRFFQATGFADKVLDLAREARGS